MNDQTTKEKGKGHRKRKKKDIAQTQEKHYTIISDYKRQDQGSHCKIYKPTVQSNCLKIKNKFRTNEAEKRQKIKNSEPRVKITGSYKEKRVYWCP